MEVWNLAAMFPISTVVTQRETYFRQVGWALQSGETWTSLSLEARHSTAHVPSGPQPDAQARWLLHQHLPTRDGTHRSIQPSSLVHGQVPPREEPFDGHHAHFHRSNLQDAWKESGRFSHLTHLSRTSACTNSHGLRKLGQEGSHDAKQVMVEGLEVLVGRKH